MSPPSNAAPEAVTQAACFPPVLRAARSQCRGNLSVAGYAVENRPPLFVANLAFHPKAGRIGSLPT